MKLIYNINLILNFIQKNHLTKTGFCRMCKISLTTFKNILLNKNISTYSMYKVAELLKVKFKDLIFYKY